MGNDSWLLTSCADICSWNATQAVNLHWIYELSLMSVWTIITVTNCIAARECMLLCFSCTSEGALQRKSVHQFDDWCTVIGAWCFEYRCVPATIVCTFGIFVTLLIKSVPSSWPQRAILEVTPAPFGSHKGKNKVENRDASPLSSTLKFKDPLHH